MSAIAALIRAGVDPDLIQQVAEEMAEARAKGALEASSNRSSAAVRQARYRERKAPQNVTGHNSVTDVTLVAGGDEPEKEKAPQTPKKENPPSKENPPKGGQKKGSPLSADWAPNPADWAEAVRTLGEPRAKLELSKFRDHWLSVGGRKVDWDATWRNWFRKAPDFAPRFGSAPQLAAGIVKPHIRESLVWVEEGSADWSLWMRARPGYVKSQQEERSENGKTLVGAYLPSAQPVKQGVAA